LLRPPAVHENERWIGDELDEGEVVGGGILAANRGDDDTGAEPGRLAGERQLN
jgi:hypothetical protein